MPLPVGSIAQVTYEYRHFGQRLLNTCHWFIETAGTTPDQGVATQEMANYFGSVGAGGIANKILALLPSSVTLEYVRAQLINPVRYAYFFKTLFSNGTRGVSPTPNVDFVITKRTAFSGRREVGDWYLPGADPADMLGGAVDPIFQGLIDTNMQWLKTHQTMPVSGAILGPVIFHRGSGTASDITSIIVQGEVRVMTRRTVGRGE